MGEIYSNLKLKERWNTTINGKPRFRLKDLPKDVSVDSVARMMGQRVICLCCAVAKFRLLPKDAGVKELIKGIKKTRTGLLTFAGKDIAVYADKELTGKYGVFHVKESTGKAEVEKAISEKCLFFQIDADSTNHDTISNVLDAHSSEYRRFDIGSLAAVYLAKSVDAVARKDFEDITDSLGRVFDVIDFLKCCFGKPGMPTVEEQVKTAYFALLEKGAFERTDHFMKFDSFKGHFSYVPIMHILEVHGGDVQETFRFISNPGLAAREK